MENRDIILIIALVAAFLILIFIYNIAVPYSRFTKNKFICPNCGYYFKQKRELIFYLILTGRLMRAKFCPKCKFRK